MNENTHEDHPQQHQVTEMQRRGDGARRLRAETAITEGKISQLEAEAENHERMAVAKRMKVEELRRNLESMGKF